MLSANLKRSVLFGVIIGGMLGCNIAKHHADGTSNGDATPAQDDADATAQNGDWYKLHSSGDDSGKQTGKKIDPPRGTAASAGGGPRSSGCGGGGNNSALGCVTVPVPSATDIVNQTAAIQLGKALFWDTQVGGDGNIACASCHYSAGADTRLTNTLHPGPDNAFATGGVTGPGMLASLVDITNDDRFGSQGIVGAIFVKIDPDATKAADICSPDLQPPFAGNRRVTGRNTPPVVGAVFNYQNFWDGRANNNFNGFDPFGSTANTSNKTVVFGNGSLASQAVGPINNATEMSCAGRPFNGEGGVGAKLLVRKALQFQNVSPSDSVLGSMAGADKGLKCGDHACTYQELVNTAFSAALAGDSTNNFSRIWGQAIQAYESTLIPNDTPYDRYLNGQSTAMTPNQIAGANVFSGKGNCTTCHAGAELSDASISMANRGRTNRDGGDQGFHNIGVRPTAEDLGRASSGPNGIVYSVSGSKFDRGAFKTPMLRNVGLTAPYFHNGGKSTLEDVVDFYSRGGDFNNAEKARDLRGLHFSAKDQSSLVDFLRNGLTDCRTKNQRAPFDHPSLDLPNGSALVAVGAEGTGPCP